MSYHFYNLIMKPMQDTDFDIKETRLPEAEETPVQATVNLSKFLLDGTDAEIQKRLAKVLGLKVTDMRKSLARFVKDNDEPEPEEEDDSDGDYGCGCGS